MGDHTELRIDTGHARSLAADLAHSGQSFPTLLPPLIEGPGTHRFLAAATAALDTTLRRAEAARQQARELADSSFSSVWEIEDADVTFGAGLGRL
ncbi:hypothetical protein COCCU_02965 [Corynebacterium occultum]|uniref:Uncharacterized protein n=1 Tax=Corynebacterium occultum TaxID=2675219 RepID=A0A6B8W3Q1_9CORY|nr:hypothetical protein [Corynebacterium occultum]QGU06547.1 hypothetical protein COCCU_02965 [Corynebacterium occultum]